MAEDPHEIAASILSRLAKAWNAADGTGWGSEFVEDADFVNMFGVQLRGRSEILKRHQYLFDSLFAGSTCEFNVVDARPLAPNVILAHSTGVAKIPAGPMAGEQPSRQSIVIVQDAGTWRVASLHNTLIAPQL
jgi:uncharacterized protein (TIGR02246 family)